MNIDENMTLTELVEEYNAQEQKVHTLDYSDLSEDDKKLLAEFSDKKKFLNEMGDALDFVQNSTAVVVRGEGAEQQFSLESMMTAEGYAASTLILTNGFDEQFVEMLQKQKNSFEAREQNAQMYTAVDNPVIQQEIEQLQEERTQEEITVAEAQAEMERVQQERERYELEKQQNEPDHTAERFAELAAATALTVIAVESVAELTQVAEKVKEETERNKPVEIVEGNDGVLNVSKAEEVAPERVSEVQEEIKQKVEDIEKAFEKGDKGNREDSDRVKAERKEEKTERDAAEKPKAKAKSRSIER